MKKAEIDNRMNLNLNSTAKKSKKVIDTTSPYLMNATYFVI